MIKIVESRAGSENDGRTRVEETLRPGYLSTGGDEGEKVLRKAEVVTSN